MEEETKMEIRLYQLQVKSEYGYAWKTIFTDSILENVIARFQRIEAWAENIHKDFRIYEVMEDETIIEY